MPWWNCQSGFWEQYPELFASISRLLYALSSRAQQHPRIHHYCQSGAGSKGWSCVLEGNSTLQFSPPHQSVLTEAAPSSTGIRWMLTPPKKKSCDHHIHLEELNACGERAALVAGNDKHFQGWIKSLNWTQKNVSKCKTNRVKEGKQHEADIYFLPTPRQARKPITASTYFPKRVGEMGSFEANIYQTFYRLLKWAIRGIDVYRLLSTNLWFFIQRAFYWQIKWAEQSFSRRSGASNAI